LVEVQIPFCLVTPFELAVETLPVLRYDRSLLKDVPGAGNCPSPPSHVVKGILARETPAVTGVPDARKRTNCPGTGTPETVPALVPPAEKVPLPEKPEAVVTGPSTRGTDVVTVPSEVRARSLNDAQSQFGLFARAGSARTSAPTPADAGPAMRHTNGDSISAW
jgi:hypothetical protein